MTMLKIFLFTVMAAFAAATQAQEIQRLDPALDQLVPVNAKLERVATGFDKWTEGPVWTRSGSLLFAVIPSNSIMQLTPGKHASVFIHPSGYTGEMSYG